MTEQKVEAPHGNAAGRDVHGESGPVVQIQSVSGTSIIGTQGDVHLEITTERKPAIRVVVQPGPEHIGEAEKLQLKALHTEWVALHDTLKKAPLAPALAWSRINRAAGATSYHLILAERFEAAVHYVQQEMAKLRAMRSAPAKDADWRARRIGAIKARCKNQLGNIDAYKAYIKRNFGADSLSALATDELQKTYAYIFAKKPA